MNRIVVRCDDADVPASALEDRPTKLEINSRGPQAKLTLRVQPISDALKGTVEDRAADLCRIASYVYWADQMVSRGGETDVFGDDWHRSFMVCIPVTDPDFWNEETLRNRLETVLGFVADEKWAFYFSKANFERQLNLDTDPSAVHQYPDSVVLFSGGVDSLCATVDLAEAGGKPVLVSHHSVSMIDHRQRGLISLLRQRLTNWGFPQVSVLVNKTKSRERDTAQRTRSFLFASLGVGVASALGVADVILADNGIVSLNLPINDQLLGSLASRSTHPRFINFFNEMVTQILPDGPTLSNPLWNRTRAETLETLKKAKVSELLQEANSCSHSRGLPNVTPHCGVCSQCIDRRFGSLAAGLEEHDVGERYRTDVFRVSLFDKALAMAESYVRFAQRVAPMSEEQIFEEYPQMEECILPDDPTPNRTAETLAKMVKRHAAQTMQVLEYQVGVARAELVAGTLPATCLIQLAVTREPANIPDRAMPRINLTKKEELEFSKHRFKSRHVIRITGQTEGRKSNVVLIDAREVIVPDAEFKLLMRLVVGLYEVDDGYIELGRLLSGGGVAAEGVVNEEDIYRAISRLRARVGPALEGPKRREFIEVRRNRIRLSTHKRYLLADRERLLSHRDDVIRQLAQRLPRRRIAKVAPKDRA